MGTTLHPPTQNTTGLAVEECENGCRACFGEMFALFWKRRMTPTALIRVAKQSESVGALRGTTALAVGLHANYYFDKRLR